MSDRLGKPITQYEIVELFTNAFNRCSNIEKAANRSDLQEYITCGLLKLMVNKSLKKASDVPIFRGISPSSGVHRGNRVSWRWGHTPKYI